MNDVWRRRKVLVTGGASFIGSHLIDALVERGASVRIVDDLSSGSTANVRGHLTDRTVEFIEADLHEPGVARRVVDGIEVVFHLAADHGGRGYVDTDRTPRWKRRGSFRPSLLMFQHSDGFA